MREGTRRKGVRVGKRGNKEKKEKPVKRRISVEGEEGEYSLTQRKRQV